MKPTLFIPLLLLLSPAWLLAENAEASPQAKANPVDQAQLQTLTPVVADARLSTVRLISRNWAKPICIGCVVHEGGWIISKASEVDKYKEIDAQFSPSEHFPSGLRVPIRLVSRHKEYDLALLKAEASGFKAVRWHSGSPPVPGSLLVASSPDATPLAFGVSSVEVRNLDLGGRGFLGIRLGEENAIENIIADSPAAKGGIVLKDVLLKLNDKEVKSIEDFQDIMSQLKPSDQVRVELKRDKDVKKLEVTLQRRSDFPDAMHNNEDPRNSMSGGLSSKRSGFPAAMQHDLTLKPEECGSPLLDLEGNVVGLNIARSGRIDSMAIPAKVLIELLQDVPKGHFRIPEAEELKKQIQSFESDQRKANEDKERIKAMEGKLTKGLEDARKRLDALLGPPVGK